MDWSLKVREHQRGDNITDTYYICIRADGMSTLRVKKSLFLRALRELEGEPIAKSFST